MGRMIDDVGDEDEQGRIDDTVLRDRLLESRQANYENLDKAILSLSSATLALSLAFFKDVVPIEQAVHIDVLFTSWICLGLTIGFNLVSFWAAQSAHDLRLAEIGGDKEAQAGAKRYSTLTEWLNRIGIVLYLIAICCSIIFVIMNVSEAQRRKPMNAVSNSLSSQPSNTSKPGQPPNPQEPDYEKRAIVPPKPPARPPSQAPSSPRPSQEEPAKSSSARTAK